jgi:glycine oxidase
MALHPDVLILGGGVIGLTTAYYLSAEGVSVSVLDRDDLGRQASWAGAGIIAPGDPAKATSPIDRLRANSSALFPTLSAQLREETGIDNGYVACGGIELPGEAALPTEHWRAEGIAFEELDGAALRRAAPELAAELDRGYFLPGMAQVRNPRHLQALIAACERRAVGLLPGCAVLAIERRGDRVRAVETEQGRFEAKYFLVATGAWTADLLAPLGWRPAIAPVRGQIVLLYMGSPAARPIVLQDKRYLVPRLDGRVLAGATEEDAGFDARATAGGVAGLLEFAQRIVPSLRDATLERYWAGLRPGSPDGLPLLGLVPGCSNMFIAAGHFRAGIQLSPATGVVMTDLLLGREPPVSLGPFRPDRPHGPPGQTAFRS